ncbi:MAG: hypothetical protein LBK22_04260 [Tannerella sp.]|jgi:hypothetical protein|nr:hypothetical protein [Tannerella sp.]
MKVLSIAAVLLAALHPAAAQNFTFESAAVPAEWSAVQGTLALSSEHYKEGMQCLQWSTAGTSQIIVSLPAIAIHSGNSAFMQIYLPEATGDTLIVDFMNGIVLQRRARFLCNTRGWREFNRAYAEYASTASATVNALRITLQPADAGQRRIFFDDVRLNQTTAARRVPGTQWILDRAYMTANSRPLAYHANHLAANALPAPPPAAQEIADLHRLRAACLEGITPAYNAVQAIAARNHVNSTANILLNTDGTLSGTVIDTQPAALTVDAATTILQRLAYLAVAAINSVAGMQDVFSRYLDHVLDQGLAEGCHLIFEPTDYAGPRALIPLVLNLIPACTTDAQLAQVVRLGRWLAFYGAMYEPEETYLQSVNSDIVYLHASYMQLLALYEPDDAQAVRELRAMKRFLERYTESVPGGKDMLKPDGTGFHHNAHYNNYMYAYQSLADCMYLFRGTAFRVSADAYLRFRRAILAVYTMATLHTGDSRFFANTLSGRNPFNAGITLRFTKARFEQLIAVGGDCLGTPLDDELAGAYNYFFQSAKYVVPARTYDGFHQFNYGSLGIFRRDGWVATMHAPTVKCWGSEIYSGANRFGRYQSHGALEITYSGASQAASGYPAAAANGGGWDWNVVPGATTVHYTSWQDMMPNRNTTQRFDQYTKTKSFAGALSAGDCGIFACDFDQTDVWGAQQFTPTNLVFKKSMFAFDRLIISLGSDIASSGSYDGGMVTATNLFQSILPTSGGTLLLNGAPVAKPYRQTLNTAVDNWIITPQGTGYCIPRGNDALTLFYDAQATPKQDGSDFANPVTTATAAKAYISHGVKPASAKYCFIAAPAATAADMAALTAQAGDGSLYTIHAQSSSLHALTYRPANTTAYAFFKAMSGLSFGIVHSVSMPLLLIDKGDASTGRHRFSVCNPDLNPKSDPAFGWISQPATAILTLAGEWLPVTAVPGVSFLALPGGDTQVTVSLSDGLPVHFDVRQSGDTSLEQHRPSQWIRFTKTQHALRLFLTGETDRDVHVNLYSLSGAMVGRHILSRRLDRTKEIPLSAFPPGEYFCVATSGSRTSLIRFMNDE